MYLKNAWKFLKVLEKVYFIIHPKQPEKYELPHQKHKVLDFQRQLWSEDMNLVLPSQTGVKSLTHKPVWKISADVNEIH